MSVFLIGGNYVIVLLGRTEKRKLIYQKISAPVFAARGIERKSDCSAQINLAGSQKRTG